MLAVLPAVVPAVVIEVLLEVWLDTWVLRSVNGLWDRGISQFPFNDTIDCFAQVSHTGIHAIGIPF
jgi:hypothetical protein